MRHRRRPERGVAASWGEPGYVDVAARRELRPDVTSWNTPWEAETGDEMWQEMSESFGPIKTLLGALPPERAEASRRELRDFFAGEQVDGEVVLDRPFLLVRRRAEGLS